jgi:hypothetical protein
MSLDTRATTLTVHQPLHKYLAANVRLMFQLRRPRISALVNALGQQAQRYEDAAFGYLIGILLDYAIGDQLDKWGLIVGEVRGGLRDDDYRRFINARILTNRSHGTTDELIAIAQLVTAPSRIQFTTIYPAGVCIYTFRAEAMSDQVVRRAGAMLRAAKAAGVAMELGEVVAGYFGWYGDADAEGFDFGAYSRSF